MKKEECSHDIKEAVMSDGVRLRYRDWTPSSPKGSIVCFHGIRSHSAWYCGSGGYLSRRGYRVIFPDRRGSGLNQKERSPNPSWGRWVEDGAQFARIAARELPGKPVHLIGISWGARIAAMIAKSEPGIGSAVFSTPGLAAVADYTLPQKIRIVLALVFKKEREYLIPLDDPALFTDDPDERNYIEEDAFGVRFVSAGFLRESRRIEKAARKAFTGIRIPLLLLLAGRDQIVDNEAVKRLFALCRTSDKVMKVYEMARHTLEFDSRKEQYMSDLLQWLDSHV